MVEVTSIADLLKVTEAAGEVATNGEKVVDLAGETGKLASALEWAKNAPGAAWDWTKKAWNWMPKSEPLLKNGKEVMKNGEVVMKGWKPGRAAMIGTGVALAGNIPYVAPGAVGVVKGAGKFVGGFGGAVKEGADKYAEEFQSEEARTAALAAEQQNASNPLNAIGKFFGPGSAIGALVFALVGSVIPGIGTMVGGLLGLVAGQSIMNMIMPAHSETPTPPTAANTVGTKPQQASNHIEVQAPQNLPPAPKSQKGTGVGAPIP